MIRIKNGKDLAGNPIELTIQSSEERLIDATGLTLLPAAIDGHVHFRNPGFREKETWTSGAKAAFAGGVTTVFDMPNTSPATTSLQLLREKRALVEKELAESALPLRSHFYFGATAHNAREIALLGDEAIGVKVFMGSSTGSLLVDDVYALEEIFAAAEAAGKVVALHAEDEALIRERKALFAGNTSPSVHSRIRSEEVAAKAIQTALALCRKTGCTLYFLHISAEEELELIAKGKQEGLPIYAEASPHHLFLSTDEYETLGTKALMNPPLRSPHHQRALWDALRSGVIDTIGSDHAPHPLHEKSLPYGRAPSGVPGVETTLPLLLTAFKEGKISAPRLLSALRYKIEEFFPLPKNDDCVLVDLETKRKVEESALSSLAGWSPYAGYELTGWPQITIAQGKVVYEEVAKLHLGQNLRFCDLPDPFVNRLPSRVCRFTNGPGKVAKTSNFGSKASFATPSMIPNWSPGSEPLYHIEKSYLENAFEGPFFTGEIPERSFPSESEWVDFLGFKVASTIGVPAGPLLNARWIALAGKLGFDIVLYKTIRSRAHPGHPVPNMVFVEMKEGKAIQRGLPSSLEELSVTNSFGMPSMNPAFLREDIPRAKASLRKGQLLIVSVVGEGEEFFALQDDFVKAALFAKEAGAPAIEVNFSCPNVKGAEGMLYTDPEKVFSLGKALKSALGPTPVIAKIGSIPNSATLAEVLCAAAESGIRAISGLNSVSARVSPPLSPTRETSGICGSAIRGEAIRFLKEARRILNEKNLPLTLIGVGGIVAPDHFGEFFLAGADSAMCATGMMWDPFLAMRYHNSVIREREECVR